MQSSATTVSAYLKELPPERAKAMNAVRQTILKNLPKGYEEGMSYGMIGYYVPLKTYPKGYAGTGTQPLPYISLASQKNYMSLYLFCNYMEPKFLSEFTEEWKKTGKKLDMGKSCVHFKSINDLALPVIARAVKKVKAKDCISMYDQSRDASGKKPKPKSKSKK